MVDQVHRSVAAPGFVPSPGVVEALARAFPGARAEDLAPLPGGRSGAQVLGFTVAGAPYVLKERALFHGDPGEERRREIACLTIASKLGVAPRVHHLDEASGITISARIAPALPARSVDERLLRLARIARGLRTLHDGPRFGPGGTALAFVGRIDAACRANGGGGLPSVLLEMMTEITSVTGRFAAEAPCHRDLNPGNVLVAEEGVFFVDWDSAAQGDRFFDIAEMCVFSASTRELRDHFLAAYLGRDPNPEERARATVMRVMALGFYSSGFLLHAALAGRKSAAGAPPLSIAEMVGLMATSGGAAPPETVADSLLGEMKREMATDAYEAAKRALVTS